MVETAMIENESGHAQGVLVLEVQKEAEPLAKGVPVSDLDHHVEVEDGNGV